MQGKQVMREPQPITVAEFFDPKSGLPEKTELVKGMIGPFSNAGIRTRVVSWGADRVLAATGAEIWREALKVAAKVDS